jgi:hypothetical protein
MSRLRFARAAGLIAVLGLAAPAAPGQESQKRRPPKADSRPQVMRQVYVALGDAAAALREIDRPARTVHVEVLCIELAGKEGGEAGGGKPLDRAELSGTAREVRAKLRDLQQKGAIGSITTVELTGLAGQSTRAQVSESRPFTTGVSFRGGAGFPGRGGAGGRGGPGGAGGRGGPGGGAGATARSVSYRDVGVSVQVKPEVGPDGQVTLDLRVEDSRMRAAEGGVALATDDKGEAVPATAFVASTLETRLRVRPGHIVLAQSTTARSKAGQVQRVILVGASTEEAGRKDGK